ncbi:SART-1 family protein DOT2 [Coffea arabica]|uniref:SART-1 family protein DOT2 n=1 Tax=Coffea arabica TaxID=13443 RepID=A0ABM4WM36_COFAR
MQDKESKNEENPHKKGEEAIPDGIMREVSVGKGLSGALKLLLDQGCLKETKELSNPKTGSKTSKLGGIYDDRGQREIIIERRDELGNVMNEKEAFRQLCYKFQGKRPGKTKQDKRMRRIEREKNVKLSSQNSEESMVLMDNALKKLQKPYLVIEGKKRAT